jgi:hypothetical protein
MSAFRREIFALTRKRPALGNIQALAGCHRKTPLTSATAESRKAWRIPS